MVLGVVSVVVHGVISREPCFSYSSHSSSSEETTSDDKRAAVTSFKTSDTTTLASFHNRCDFQRLSVVQNFSMTYSSRGRSLLEVIVATVFVCFLAGE